jgi:hypothetical protein
VSFGQYLYGTNNVTAFCHLPISSEWPVDKLVWVLVQAQVPTGVVKARLCLSVEPPICGVEATITATTAGFPGAMAPASIPPGMSVGAYLEVTFPPGGWSRLQKVMPVWKP